MEPTEETRALNLDPGPVDGTSSSVAGPVDGTASSVPGPVDGTTSKPSRAAMYKAALGRKLSIVQLVCGVVLSFCSFFMIITLDLSYIAVELNGLRVASTLVSNLNPQRNPVT